MVVVVVGHHCCLLPPLAAAAAAPAAAQPRGASTNSMMSGGPRTAPCIFSVTPEGSCAGAPTPSHHFCCCCWSMPPFPAWRLISCCCSCPSRRFCFAAGASPRAQPLPPSTPPADALQRRKFTSCEDTTQGHNFRCRQSLSDPPAVCAPAPSPAWSCASSRTRRVAFRPSEPSRRRPWSRQRRERKCGGAASQQQRLCVRRRNVRPRASVVEEGA